MEKRKNYNVSLDQTSNAGKDSEGWYRLQVKNKKGLVTQSQFYFKEGQNFNNGALLYRRVNSTSGYIIADSVKFVKVGSQP